MYAIVPVFVGGFLAGVLLRSLFDFGLFETTALLVGAVCVYAVAHLRQMQLSLLVVLAVFAGLLGIVRTDLAQQSYNEHRMYEDGTHISAVGAVVAEPDKREDHTVLFLLLHVGSTSKDYIKVRARVPQYPVYEYGDGITVTGTVHVPESFETETGRTFDYPGYLMKDHVHYTLKVEDIAASGEQGGSVILKRLLEVKAAWLATVSLHIPEPNASLAGGVVVGAKRSLGDKWLDAFRDTGIIHIVVLSGYNLTLVANGIIRATGFLPRVAGLGLGTVGVIGFALMTGAGPTIVRASVMAILGMLATYLNRPYAILRALGIAAFLMVLHNPFLLLFDPGFQLSCIATIGLIIGAPLFEERLLFITEYLGLRGIVAATLSTQLAVLPLLMYQIGVVSLVAPLVNVLILPIVPTVMALGSLVGLVGFVSTALAVPLAWLTHGVLSYMFMIVGLFNSLPFAAVSLPALPWWSLIVLYLSLYLLYVRLYKTTQG